MATYVVSDLHGQYEIFRKLLEKASFSNADQLFMLGDAIDRGPEGIKILKHVMNAPNMKLLLGNHEFMMLNSVALDGNAERNNYDLPGPKAELWLRKNGGNKTYDEYALLKKEDRVELLNWLMSCSLSTLIEVGKTPYLLTHSYFDKDKIDVAYKDIDYDTGWKIVWKSPFRPDLFVPEIYYKMFLPWTFVIGHVPVSAIGGCGINMFSPYKTSNIIDIDGGCADKSDSTKSCRGGILLRLDDLASFTCSFDEL